MTSRNHRDGGKFGGGKHTTFIDLASIMADIANDCPEVTKISAGFIKAGEGCGGGGHRVKIGDMIGGVLLTIRQSGSVQEVRIISRDPAKTKLAIARGARDRDVAICFAKKGE